jgi:hypothetical protein
MMFLTVRGDPHSLQRREGRNLQPRQHPTTAIVAALLLCHGDGEPNADMNFAVEMDEASGPVARGGLLHRPGGPQVDGPRRRRRVGRSAARRGEAAAASGGCEVLA